MNNPENFQYIDSHQEADDGEGDDADDVLVVGDRLLELLEAALHPVGVVRIVGVQSTLFGVFFAEAFNKKFVYLIDFPSIKSVALTWISSEICCRREIQKPFCFLHFATIPILFL
jgi:hypothetical protein